MTTRWLPRTRNNRRISRTVPTVLWAMGIGFRSTSPPVVLGWGGGRVNIRARHQQQHPSGTLANHPTAATVLRTTTTLTLVPVELLSDVVTSGAINTVSDCVAQILETNSSNSNSSSSNSSNNDNNTNSEEMHNTGVVENDEPRDAVVDTPAFLSWPSSGGGSYDAPRTQRLALFGLADGAVSHAWFLGLDTVVGEGQGWTETLAKTVADSLVYTPLWCAWFLAFATLLEGHDDGATAGGVAVGTRLCSIPSVWRSDWLELLRGNLGFFLPLTGLVYGFVPRDGRVLAFGLAGLVYTTILSLWNQSRGGNGNGNGNGNDHPDTLS